MVNFSNSRLKVAPPKVFPNCRQWSTMFICDFCEGWISMKYLKVVICFVEKKPQVATDICYLYILKSKISWATQFNKMLNTGITSKLLYICTQFSTGKLGQS